MIDHPKSEDTEKIFYKACIPLCAGIFFGIGAITYDGLRSKPYTERLGVIQVELKEKPTLEEITTKEELETIFKKVQVLNEEKREILNSPEYQEEENVKRRRLYPLLASGFANWLVSLIFISYKIRSSYLLEQKK